MAAEFQILDAQATDFAMAWEEFFNSGPLDWRYGPGWMEYQRAYSGDRLLRDCSFLLMDDQGAKAACPLFVERAEAGPVFSSGGGWLMAPVARPGLARKAAARAEAACHERINALAKEHGVVKAQLALPPLHGGHACNGLAAHGFLDASTQTAVVALDLEEEQLWRELRKSYKALINKGLASYAVHITDYADPQREMHENYRQLHHLAAGRVTRSRETFDLMYEELLQDRAMLIGLTAKGRPVAFSYYFHDARTAYYGSACEAPDYQGPVPLGHVSMWSAMTYYARRGFRALEIGPVSHGPQLFDQPTDKERSIGFYKLGFGSDVRAWFRGVKYYDPDLMNRELTENVRKLVEAKRHA